MRGLSGTVGSGEMGIGLVLARQARLGLDGCGGFGQAGMAMSDLALYVMTVRVETWRGESSRGRRDGANKVHVGVWSVGAGQSTAGEVRR